MTGTINHKNPDVQQVAAALADACHAGGLSDAYYRTADDVLGRMAAEIDELRRRLALSWGVCKECETRDQDGCPGCEIARLNETVASQNDKLSVYYAEDTRQCAEFDRGQEAIKMIASVRGLLSANTLDRSRESYQDPEDVLRRLRAATRRAE